MDTFKLWIAVQRRITCMEYILFLFVILFSNNYVLSTRTESCHVCDRTPRSCKRISGIYTVTKLSTGYNPIMEIPRGACRINITELGPSSNYIALKTKSGKNILNALWAIVGPGYHHGAGTSFLYSRSRGPECPGECIHSRGQTNETLLLQILYYNTNPGIAYDYILPPGADSVDFNGYYSIPGHTNSRPGGNRRHHQRHGYREPTIKQGNRQEYGRFYPEESNNQRSHTFSNENSQYAGKPYGEDTLQGRGLSYRLPYTDNKGQRSSARGHQQVRFAQRPTYVNPYAGRRNPTYGSQPLQGRKHSNSGQSLTDSQPVRSTEERRQSFSEGSSSRSHNGQNTIPEYNVPNQGPWFTGDSVPGYSWKISGFAECSLSCGGGTQETLVVCVKGNSQVTSENCDDSLRPRAKHVSCNTSPCPADWEKDDWGSCSRSCGTGSQTRLVECRQRISVSLHPSVSASLCSGQAKPATIQQCGQTPCAQWKTSDWGQCSVECGRGARTRQVQCVGSDGSNLPLIRCPPGTPRSKESCYMGSCNRQWYYSLWSGQCSSDCGSGVMTRSALCGSTDGGKLPPSHCSSKKQKTERVCQNTAPCGGSWFVGPWSKCTAVCGSGIRKRDVVCMKKLTNSLTALVSDDNCQASGKPSVEESCTREICGAEWYMTKWSACSTTCGSGYKSREVSCLDQNQSSAVGCDSAEKPVTREACRRQSCGGTKNHSDPQCRDRYRNCRVVVQARLCKIAYYKRICCESCNDH